MKKRPFGNTGLEVSILGFGAMHLGTSDADDTYAEQMLNAVLDLGVNVIDTARSYGRSEEQIGKFLSHRRNEFILSTKVGYDVEMQPDWSYEAVTGGIEQALKLMKTDYIDIAHLHSCSLDILERGDVIRGLEEGKQAGKVRFIAYSGENEALEFAIRSDRFDSVQASVNICDQKILENHMPGIREKGLGMIAKRPLANATWRHNSPPIGHYSVEYWYRMQKMKIDPHGLEWNELALRFSAYSPGVSTCIAGSSKIEHFMENLKAIIKGPLPDELSQHIRSEFLNHDNNWIGVV